MIGLFLGDTDFSEIVLKKIKKLNKKYFIIDFSKNNKFKKNINLVTKSGGVILLITGVLILTNQLQILGYYILNYLPFLQNFG